MTTIMEVIEPKARMLELMDEQIGKIRHELDSLVSDRETLSNEVVALLQEQGIETSLGLTGGGTIKLDTQLYPSIKDLGKLQAWAEEKSVMLPAFTINAKTMQGWIRGQMDNNLPVPPEDAVTVFLKTKAKVLKK